MKQLSNADIAAKVRKAMKDEASAINYLADFFDGDQIAEVAKTIANCQGRIFTSACGTSGVTAKKIAHTMSCIEVPASIYQLTKGTIYVSEDMALPIQPMDLVAF